MPINSTYVIFFGRLDIILKNSRTSFYLFYSHSFNFIVLRSRATSIWYQSLTMIRDQVIYICFWFLFRSFKSFVAFIHKNQDPEPSFNLFRSLYFSSSTSSLNPTILETKFRGPAPQHLSPSPHDSTKIDEINPHTTTPTDHQSKIQKKILHKSKKTKAKETLWLSLYRNLCQTGSQVLQYYIKSSKNNNIRFYL